MNDFAPGTMWWWGESHGGRVVHWSLVESRGVPSWMGGSVAVVSIRSGRQYCANPDDLIPYVSLLDPRETCARCGVQRRDHRARHNFETERDHGS